MAGLRSKLSSVTTTSKALSFSSKSSQTELSDIGKSLIAIDKMSENKSIVNGVKFYGHGNNRQWRGHGVVWGGNCPPPLLPKDGPRDSFKIEEKMVGYRFGKILSQKWPDEIT